MIRNPAGRHHLNIGLADVFRRFIRAQYTATIRAGRPPSSATVAQAFMPSEENLRYVDRTPDATYRHEISTIDFEQLLRDEIAAIRRGG